MGISTGEQRPEYMKTYQTKYAKKKRQVNISLDLEDYKKLDQEAHSQDIKASALAKQYVLDGLGENKRAVLQVPKINQETAQELTRLMRTMANNFNQVAYHMNLSSHLDGYDSTINPEVAIGSMYQQLQDMEQKIKTTLTQQSTYDH